MRRSLLLCTLLWLMARPLAAQSRPGTLAPLPGRIEGRLLDADTERPVEGAAVRILGLDVPTEITGSSGQFGFLEVPRGVYAIEISHIAYGTGSHLVNVPEGETVDFVARVRPSPIELEPLVVEADVSVSRLAEVGFLQRKKRGWGHFFSGAQADAWRIREALYSVPGLNIVQGQSILDQRVVIRRLGRVCTPEVYLDGVLQRWAEGDVEDVIMGQDIEGVEIYRGLGTPAEFASNAGAQRCGAIVIWTRR